MTPRLANSLVAAASLAVALAGLEVVVRVLDIPPHPIAPLQVPMYRLSANPIIAYEYKLGYVPPKGQPPELVGYPTNARGFRDRDYTEEKPDNVFRILVLGDSTTAGNGVNRVERTYTKRLEALLNRRHRTNRVFEVLNMGVGGYHTLQEAETLREKGRAFDPDVVFMTFCLNDFNLHSDGNIFRQLVNTEQHRTSVLRYFGFHKLLRSSRLALVVYARLNNVMEAHDSQYRTAYLKDQTTVGAGFALLAAESARMRKTSYVFILPGFDSPFSAYRHGEIHDRVRAEAALHPEIEVVDLLEAFRTVSDDPTGLSNDTVHMNEAGHEVMANILLDFIEKRLMPPGAASMQAN